MLAVVDVLNTVASVVGASVVDVTVLNGVAVASDELAMIAEVDETIEVVVAASEVVAIATSELEVVLGAVDVTIVEVVETARIEEVDAAMVELATEDATTEDEPLLVPPGPDTLVVISPLST